MCAPINPDCILVLLCVHMYHMYVFKLLLLVQTVFACFIQLLYTHVHL